MLPSTNQKLQVDSSIRGHEFHNKIWHDCDLYNEITITLSQFLKLLAHLLHTHPYKVNGRQLNNIFISFIEELWAYFAHKWE